MCYPMGCGNSTDSVATPQPSDYYVDRASGVSRADIVSFIVSFKIFVDFSK